MAHHVACAGTTRRAARRLVEDNAWRPWTSSSSSCPSSPGGGTASFLHWAVSGTTPGIWRSRGHCPPWKSLPILRRWRDVGLLGRCPACMQHHGRASRQREAPALVSHSPDPCRPDAGCLVPPTWVRLSEPGHAPVGRPGDLQVQVSHLHHHGRGGLGLQQPRTQAGRQTCDDSEQQDEHKSSLLLLVAGAPVVVLPSCPRA